LETSSRGDVNRFLELDHLALPLLLASQLEVLGSLDGDLKKRKDGKNLLQTSGKKQAKKFRSLVRKSLSTESNNEDASGDEKMNIMLK
jgi:hypothetical protein